MTLPALFVVVVLALALILTFVWLRGFQKAREYDLLLMGKTVETKRERKEQDYRNKQLLMKIKESNQQGETA